jgi:broad specificity phosphatase PhoE
MQVLTGPEEFVLVRHAESLGNVANQAAHDQAANQLELEVRDADMMLSPLGVRQARVLGQHLDGLREDRRPTMVFSSPYLRALSTAEAAAARVDAPIEVDERLRERELGLMDGMTGRGIRELYPAEADRRQWLGKFYYRPPSGESWCDVVQRIRQFLIQLSLARLEGERVWVFSHQAVILAFRVAFEGLSEKEVLDIDASTPLPNCSMTRYTAGAQGRWSLASFADTSGLSGLEQQTHEQPTAERRGGEGDERR